MTVSSLAEIEVVLKLEATRPNLTAIVEFRVRSLASSFGSSFDIHWLLGLRINVEFRDKAVRYPDCNQLLFNGSKAA